MFTDKCLPVKCLPGNEMIIRASGGSMKELQDKSSEIDNVNPHCLSV